MNFHANAKVASVNLAEILQNEGRRTSRDDASWQRGLDQEVHRCLNIFKVTFEVVVVDGFELMQCCEEASTLCDYPFTGTDDVPHVLIGVDGHEAVAMSSEPVKRNPVKPINVVIEWQWNIFCELLLQPNVEGKEIRLWSWWRGLPTCVWEPATCTTAASNVAEKFGDGQGSRKTSGLKTQLLNVGTWAGDDEFVPFAQELYNVLGNVMRCRPKCVNSLLYKSAGELSYRRPEDPRDTIADEVYAAVWEPKTTPGAM